MEGLRGELEQGDPEEGAGDALHAVMRFLRVVWNRRLLVSGCLAVCAVVGAAYYILANRVYEAKAALLVTQTGSDVWSAATTGESNDQRLLPTCERLLTSSVVLTNAAKQIAELPLEQRSDFSDASRSKWDEILKKNVSTTVLRQTNIIEIRYGSGSPEAAEAVLSALLASYLEFMEKNHQDLSVEILDMLESERQDVEDKLAKKQQEMLRVKERVKDLGIRQGARVVHPAVQRVISLNDTVFEVQKTRINLQGLLASLRHAISVGADLRQHLLAIEPVVGQQVLKSTLGLDSQQAETAAQLGQKLLQDRAKLDSYTTHLGPRHPQVVELSAAIKNAEEHLVRIRKTALITHENLQAQNLGQTLLSMLQQQLAEAQMSERELLAQFSQKEHEAVRINGQMAELQIVEDELHRMRSLHKTLLDRISTIDINKQRADVRFDVVGAPNASDIPVSPRLLLVGLLAVIAGLGSGCGAVYVLDLLDDRFRTPEELQQQLGLPILAAVGEIEGQDGLGIDTLSVYHRPDAPESEAFRTMRTTLTLSQAPLERISVTSTEPSDGKTTTIGNLAASYAQSGRRTLLIDADLRKPGMTKLLDLRGEGGLSEVVRGAEQVAVMCQAVVQSTGIENLDIIPSGARPSDPAQLLGSARTADVIAWAEAHYDQVLIDCPPILAASDAAIIGRLVDGTALVVNPSKNRRRAVIRAVDQMQKLGVNIIGFVANRISQERGGYGYGYGYGYGTAYGMEDGDHDIESNVLSGNELSQQPEADLEDHNHALGRRAA